MDAERTTAADVPVIMEDFRSKYWVELDVCRQRRRLGEIEKVIGMLKNGFINARETARTPAPRIALALGGGGTRGFAHIGVIKALQSHGIDADVVVGTSVGAAIGALYAAGFSGFDLQEMTIPMREGSVREWAWPKLGLFTGKPLQEFVNKMVEQRPIEAFPRVFAAIATDLNTGERTLFRSGNAGDAVRASCAVPGLFQPFIIGDHTYVDGGLALPVPVSEARALGADLVIAVDVSSRPENNNPDNAINVLLQTFSIMAKAINRYELPLADVVISPVTEEIEQSNLEGRHMAILEGEKATAEALPKIMEVLERFTADG